MTRSSKEAAHEHHTADERMRGILEDAVAVGSATARTQLFSPREGEGEGFAYYEGSDWRNPLFTGGYEFLDPPPAITADGVVPAESDGARKLNSRIASFYLQPEGLLLRRVLATQRDKGRELSAT